MDPLNPEFLIKMLGVSSPVMYTHGYFQKKNQKNTQMNVERRWERTAEILICALTQ